ncbi:MAG: ROK family protein [Nocardioides sp.]
MVFVGVDVGGSKILVGVVDAEGRVQDLVRRITPGRATAASMVEAEIVAAVDELRDRHDVAGVGVGAAGFVGLGGIVRFAPHLPWRDEPLAEKLGVRLGLPVVVDNDANVAALAELRHGAARGVEEVLVLTLGTGIGGAVVMGGVVRRGTQGLAGEFGHLQVVPGGRPCPCGHRGCWEQYASGTALVRAAGAADGPTRVAGPDITRAARQGERWALDAFADVGGWLGVGLAGLVASMDPALVVVGGGLSDAGDLLLGPARSTLGANLPGAERRMLPPVVVAACGPAATVIGAATMARETDGGSPPRIVSPA